MIRNIVVEFRTWEAYNVEDEEEAIRQAKAEHGDEIEILAVRG